MDNKIIKLLNILGMKMKMQLTSCKYKTFSMICKSILTKYQKLCFKKIILRMNFLLRNIQELLLSLMKVKLKFRLVFLKMIKNN